MVKRAEPGKRDPGLVQQPTEQERKRGCKERRINRCSSGEQPHALGGEGVTGPKQTNKQKTALYLRREVDEEEKRFLSILREGSKAITQNISLL